MDARTEKAANDGDSEAQFQLGNAYYFGAFGATKNLVEAARWYRKAAEQNHIKAQNCLGDCYAFGRGVPQDYDEALKWFHSAAEQGDETAKVNVRYVENMKAIPIEKARGEEQFKKLEKAAAKGDANAQYELGHAYYLGDRVDKDHWKAVKWYQKAAEQGHIVAQCQLGYIYANDFHLTDYKKSAGWYRVAAEQGHVEAQFRLGLYYNHHAHTNSFLRQVGFFAKSDRIEALKWYRKAAEQGHVQAQFKLGDCYEQAVDDFLPTEWDRAEAVKWYRKAAEHGHANAQYRLGCRYRDGKGVPKNLVEAYKWLNLAWEKFQEKSRRGQELWWDEMSAGEDRDKLAALMTPDQIDEGQRLASEFKSQTESATGSSN